MARYTDSEVLNEVSVFVIQTSEATIAKLEFAGRSTTGTAKKNIDDDFNPEVGLTLALARAMEKMSNVLYKESRVAAAAPKPAEYHQRRRDKAKRREEELEAEVFEMAFTSEPLSKYEARRMLNPATGKPLIGAEDA